MDVVKISVIIATYNRSHSLVRTLESLAGQTLAPGRWEAVVVDNNSTDDTREEFAKFVALNPGFNFRMTSETAQGLSPARNRGIAGARGEYLVIIDDDQTVNGDFLKTYTGFFDSNPGVAAAGGVIIPVYETAPPRWLSHYTERMLAGALDLGRKPGEFPRGKYPGGGNMALRKGMTDKYGVFDVNLGRTGTKLMGGEEKDLFARLRAGGERIWYLPGAEVYHHIPAGRLTLDYLDRLSRTTGASERVRTRGESRAAYAARIVAEAVKWAATAALLLFYTLTLRPAKGWALVRMRTQITLGLVLSGTRAGRPLRSVR